MWSDEENLQIQELEAKSTENILFNKPGSSYLKVMQYYYEEKQLNTQPCTLKTWETFIAKHFSTSIEMKVDIFENQKLFYRIDANYGNLGYIYFHKNKSIFNKYIFINDYEEIIETDEFENEVKVLKVHNGLLVYDYQKNTLFLFIDATVKINSEFKIQHVSVKIVKIQIFDEVKMKSLNLFELKNHIFSLFLKFKNFMNVIKLLNKS